MVVHHLGTVFAHSLQVVDLTLQERYLGFQVLLLLIAHQRTHTHREICQSYKIKALKEQIEEGFGLMKLKTATCRESKKSTKTYRQWETEHKKWKLWETDSNWRAHRLFLAHGLAVGTWASDVEEGLLLGGGKGRWWSADITPSGWGEGWRGSGLTTPTGEAFYAGRGTYYPGALACKRYRERDREVPDGRQNVKEG